MLKHLTILAISFVISEGGFAGLQCPVVSLIPGVVGCNQDCQIEHGANYGNCDPLTFDCKCGPSVNPGVPGLAQQCLSKSGLLGAVYSVFCDVDCKCNHGTVGGECNFDTNVCVCGDNSTDSCPLSITPTWIQIFLQLYNFPISIIG